MNGLLLALMLLIGACGPVEQPASLQFVAAIEIPLRTPADRSDLLAMLRRHAAANGQHVDDATAQAIETLRNMPDEPMLAGRTIYVGVWRGENDDDLEVSVDDSGHPGRAWVIFSRGTQVEAATRMREGLLRNIRQRWPHAQPLPALPSGGLPLAEDLTLTPEGYRIVRSRAAGYELPADSPLLAPR